MESDTHFTDGRIPNSKIRPLITHEHRWQRWLDVEAALATAEAEVGIVPFEAATAIANHAVLAQLNVQRIRAGILETSHPLMAMVSELSAAVGPHHGGWVHWGATTQNITQTGDALILREVHTEILLYLSQAFGAMATLAEQGKDMVCAGRTHGQPAVPITFGFKVAAWIDEFARHTQRLHEIEPRVFTAMLGGAVGNYASLGDQGPIVQAKVAQLLGLRSMTIPSRAMNDAQAEYICILGLIASTTAKITKEIYVLMQAEFGEAYEPIPAGTIGSSTMPHKRNPQLADDCLAIAAQIRSLVPLAMEGMVHDHEVDGAHSQMIDDALYRGCLLTGDLLTRLVTILSGLTLNPVRMRANLDLTGGLIASEAVMLALGEKIGRQEAHEIIYNAAQAAAVGQKTFAELLNENPQVTHHLSRPILKRLLNPEAKIGLSIELSQAAAIQAQKLHQSLRHTARFEVPELQLVRVVA